MIYDWKKFKAQNTQHPMLMHGMKLTKVKLIIDGIVVKESYSIKDITHA